MYCYREYLFGKHSLMLLSCVVGLRDRQQVAMIADTELVERLIEIAGAQGNAVQVHAGYCIIDSILFEHLPDRGVAVNDNILSIHIISDSNSNHGVYLSLSFLTFYYSLFSCNQYSVVKPGGRYQATSGGRLITERQ